MSENSEILNEVKVTIRAILLSSPNGVPMHLLSKEYKEMTGYAIPYQRLGYSHLEDLIQDLKDVVSCRNIQGKKLLVGIADQSTAHIQKMVAKQKKSSVRYNPSFARGPSHKKHVHNEDNFIRKTLLPSPSPFIFNNSWTDKPVERKPPALPQALKVQIRELMKTYSNGLNIMNFSNAFYRKFQYFLDEKRLGFQNCVELLSCAADCVSLKNSGNSIIIYPLKKPNEMVNPIAPQNRVSPNWNTEKADSRTSDYHLYQSSSAHNHDDSNRTVSSTSKREPVLPEPVVQKQESSQLEAVQVCDSDSSFDSNSAQLSKVLVQEFYQILDKNKDGIWSRTLPAKYKEETNKELDIHELGFLTVIELVSAIPHVFRIERPSPLDWLLLDARKPSQAEPNLLPKTTCLEPPSTITEKGDLEQMNIKKLFAEIISQHPNGFLVSELPQKYKEYTGEEFPIQKDFESLEKTLSSQFNDILQLQYTDCGAKLLPCSRSLNNSPEVCLDHPAGIDVVEPNLDMIYQPIPRDFRTDPYFEVFVASIISPDRFWLQFRGTNTSEAMTKLMDEMDIFYNSPEAENYMVPPSYLNVGTTCVSLYQDDNFWYRAIVIRIKNDNLITIRYLDYGNVSNVSRSSLRLLRKKFSYLPAQAISAKLAHIKPPDLAVWPDETGARFLQLIDNKPLIAKILEVKDVVPFLTVTICDTTGKEDIYIHVVLVEEGLACFDDLQECPNSLKPLRRPKSQPMNTIERTSPDSGNPSNPLSMFQTAIEEDINSFRNQNANRCVDSSNTNGPSALSPSSLMWSNLQKNSLGPLNFGNPSSDPDSAFYRPDLTVNAMSNVYLLSAMNPLWQYYMNEYSKLLKEGNPYNKACSSSTFEEAGTANPELLFPPPNFKQMQQNLITVKSPPGLSRSSPSLPTQASDRNVERCDKNETYQDTLSDRCSSTSISPNCDNYNFNNNDRDLSTRCFKQQLCDINSQDLEETSEHKCNPELSLSSRASLESTSLSNYMASNTDEIRDSDSEDSNLIDQLCKELDGFDLKKHVQIHSLLDNPVHIVSYRNAPHMIGSEISLTIWKKDMLRNMLRIHKFKVENILISAEEEPLLFEELLRYNLTGIGLDDQPSSHVTLYPLESVINIFERFKVSKDLIEGIRRIQDEFSQDSINWLDFSSDVDDSHEFHELRTSLSILLTRCKSIEQQLKYDKNAALVEEHEYLMEKIHLVEEQIQNMEAQNLSS